MDDALVDALMSTDMAKDKAHGAATVQQVRLALEEHLGTEFGPGSAMPPEACRDLLISVCITHCPY